MVKCVDCNIVFPRMIEFEGHFYRVMNKCDYSKKPVSVFKE